MKDATLRQSAKILSIFEEADSDQVQALIASGFLADLRDSKRIREVNRNDVRRLFGLIPLTPAPESLLEFLGTTTIPATIKQFVARVKFVVGTGRKARVKISWLGGNLQSWFLDKIEGPAAAATFRHAKLLRSSVDALILTELGDTAETAFGQVYWFMEQQPNGERGTLLNDGSANIFYVLDVTGVLRAVGVSWRGGGWYVRARAVSDPRAWRGGDRVFSRNSSVAQTV